MKTRLVIEEVGFFSSNIDTAGIKWHISSLLKLVMLGALMLDQWIAFGEYCIRMDYLQDPVQYTVFQARGPIYETGYIGCIEKPECLIWSAVLFSKPPQSELLNKVKCD